MLLPRDDGRPPTAGTQLDPLRPDTAGRRAPTIGDAIALVSTHADPRDERVKGDRALRALALALAIKTRIGDLLRDAVNDVDYLSTEQSRQVIGLNLGATAGLTVADLYTLQGDFDAATETIDHLREGVSMLLQSLAKRSSPDNPVLLAKTIGAAEIENVTADVLVEYETAMRKKHATQN